MMGLTIRIGSDGSQGHSRTFRRNDMTRFCPIRYVNTTHTTNRDCNSLCAWHDGSGCAIAGIPEAVYELINMNRTLYDTLGSGKTGDALDAVVKLPGILETLDTSVGEWGDVEAE